KLKAFINTGDGEFAYHHWYSLLGEAGRSLSYKVRYNEAGSDAREHFIAYRIYFNDINADGLIDILRLPGVKPLVYNFSRYNYPQDISVALNTGDGFANFAQWMAVDNFQDLLSAVAIADV